MNGLPFPRGNQSFLVPAANQKVQATKALNRAYLASLPREKLLEMDKRDQAIFEKAFGKRTHVP